MFATCIFKRRPHLSCLVQGKELGGCQGLILVIPLYTFQLIIIKKTCYNVRQGACDRCNSIWIHINSIDLLIWKSFKSLKKWLQRMLTDPFAYLQSFSRVITLSNYSLLTLVFWNTCTKILYKFSYHMIIIQQMLARAIRTKEYVSIISIFHATNGGCGRMKGIYICILKILLQMYLTVSMYFYWHTKGTDLVPQNLLDEIQIIKWIKFNIRLSSPQLLNFGMASEILYKIFDTKLEKEPQLILGDTTYRCLAGMIQTVVSFSLYLLVIQFQVHHKVFNLKFKK